MSKMIINGTSINVAGNICIQNNKVYVDGKLITESKEPVKLIIEGDPVNITTEGDVEVHGNVSGQIHAGCGINCGNVGGNVKAGNSVHCEDVTGNVDAGNSVHCGNVGGDVDAGGNVVRR